MAGRGKARPGEDGEGKGPLRRCGGGRGGGAAVVVVVVVAADTVRQETHSNRPLAMTQQHAALLPSHRAIAGRKRGGARSLHLIVLDLFAQPDAVREIFLSLLVLSMTRESCSLSLFSTHTAPTFGTTNF